MKKILSAVLSAALLTQTLLSGSTAFLTVSAASYGRNENTAALMQSGNAAIIRQPVDCAVVVNGIAVFMIAVEGEGLSYQWQQLKTAEGSDWVSIGSYEGCRTDTLYAPAYEGRSGYRYRCIVTDSSGNRVYSDEAEMTLLPGATITSNPQEARVVPGREAVFTVSATGDDLIYRWQMYDTNENKWVYLTEESSYTDTLRLTASEENRGKYFRCVVTDKYGNMARSDSARLRIITELAITTQPADTAAPDDGSATFSVKVTGDDPVYQWQELGTETGSIWTDLAGVDGSTSRTVSIPASPQKNGYKYRCIITDKYGNSVQSAEASLTVYKKVYITSHPSDCAAVVNGTAVFSVTAVGEGLSYQWQQLKTDDGSDWVSIGTYEGRLSDTLLAPAYDGRSGYKYRCMVTDRYGNRVYSNEAAMTLLPGATITSNPQEARAAIGREAVFTVSATGDDLIYRWQMYDTNENKWVYLTEESGNTDTLRITASENNKWKYFRCVVTDKYGNMARSDSARLIIITLLQITSQPSDTSAADGENAVFSVKAAGDGLTFRWQQLDPGAGSRWEDIVGLDGSASRTVTIPASYNTNGCKYRCIITDQYGESVQSSEALLTVFRRAVITRHPEDYAAVFNGTAVFRVAAEGEELSYQWQQLKTAEGSDWVSIASYEGCHTDTLYAPAYEGRSGYKYRCLVTDKYGSKVYSNEATMTIVSKVSITKDTENVTAEIFDDAVFHVEASGSGLVYQWQYFGSSSEKWESVTSDIFKGMSGENTDTLRFVAEPMLEGKIQLRCMVTDSAGNVARSSPAVFAIRISGDGATVTAESFGAVGGDTVSDWRSIQSALKFARDHATANAPITVTLGEGTFILDECLQIFSNTRFSLSPDTVLSYIGGDGCMIQGGDGTRASYDTLTDVQITGGQWKGNASSTGSQTELIGFQSAGNITLDGLRMEDSSDHFIMLTGVDGMSVTNCVFRDYVKISDVDQFTKEAVHIDFLPFDDGTRFPSKNAVVNNCTFENVASGVGTHHHGYGSYETNISVSGCTFSGIIYNCVNAYSMNGLSVENCTAESCGSFLSMCDSVGTFTGNNIYRSGPRCFMVSEGSTASIKQSIIEDAGMITDVYSEEPDDKSVRDKIIAVFIRDSTGIIEGNTLSGVTGTGIMLKNCGVQSVVSGNNILNALEHGIYVTGDNVRGVTIENNSLSGCQGILASYSESRIESNTLNGCSDGISVFCGKSDIISNSIFNTGGIGIQIAGTSELTSSATIKNNVVTGSGSDDLSINSYCSCTVRNNNTGSRFKFAYSLKADIIASDNGINPPPETPLVVSDVSGTTVTLSWNDALRAESYVIYSFDAVAENLKKLAVTTDTRHIFTGLKENTKYTFLVVSSDADGIQSFYTYPTNTLSVTTGTHTAPPEIISQPRSVSAQEGDDITFSLTAIGSDLSYQWYYMKAGSTDWNVWKGHTSPSETAAANTSWNGMRLRCAVTDSHGQTVYSDTAVIKLGSGPAIVSQSGDLTLNLGDSATFSVTAEGVGIKYQWYFCKTGQTAFSVWNGRTHATETCTPNATWNGIRLYCVVKDNAGNSVRSDTVTVKVNQSLAITTQPVNKTINLGDSVTVSLKASGNGLKYQWYFCKTGQTAFSMWNGRTHASETCTPNATWNGIRLYCVVKDADGNSVKSNTVTVKVNQSLAITTQPVNKTINLGDSVTISMKASGNGLKYQWYFCKTGQTAFSVWNGRTHASETCTPNATWNGIRLYCVVKDADGNSVKSNTVTVKVNQSLAITTQPVNKTINLGDSVTVSLKASGNGLKYQWYFRKTGQTAFSAWNGHTHASETCTPNATWNGIQLYCVVTDGGGNSVKSNTVTITVK